MKFKLAFLICSIIFLSSCLKSRSGKLVVNQPDQLNFACQELKKDLSLMDLFARVRFIQNQLDYYYDLEHPEGFTDQIENLVEDLKATTLKIKSKLNTQFTEPHYEAQVEWFIPTKQLLHKVGILKVNDLQIERILEGGVEVDPSLRNLVAEIQRQYVSIKLQKRFSALELCEMRGINYIYVQLEYKIWGRSIFDLEKSVLLQF